MSTGTKKSFKYWQNRIIIVSMIAYAIFYIVRKNFSIAMPGLTAEFGISNTSFGIIIAIGSIVYGLSRFINGLIVENRSPRLLMALGLVLCAAANFCFGFGADLSYLITGCSSGPQVVNTLILLFGITIIVNQYFQGMGFPPCARMLPHWIAPNELATKMSIWNASHSIGAVIAVSACGLIMTNMGADMSGDSGIISGIADNLAKSIKGWNDFSPAEQQAVITGYVAHYGAWKWCFFIPALVALAGAVLCVLGLRDKPQSVGLPELEASSTGVAGNKAMSGEERKAFLKHMVFKNRWIWTLTLANLFVYVLRMGVLDWGPKFLTESRGMDIKGAAWSVAAFEAMAIIGTIFAGWATDRIFKGRAHRMCLVSMIGSVIFLSLFAFIKMPTVPSIICLSIAGFFVYGPQALIGIAAANHGTKEASATANGLTGFFGYIGSALSAILVGTVADKMGWGAVFTFFVLVGTVGIVVFATMWKAPRDGYERARKFGTEKF